MKTIKEWLEGLPDGIRERAIRNTKDKRLGEHAESLSQALKNAFNWYATEEKVGFWSQVNAKVKGLRADWPPIPDPKPDPILERLERIEAELRRLTELLAAEREKPKRREEWPEDLPRLEGFWYFGEEPVLSKYDDRSDDIAFWHGGSCQWIIGAYGHHKGIHYVIRKGSELAKLNGFE